MFKALIDDSGEVDDACTQFLIDWERLQLVFYIEVNSYHQPFEILKCLLEGLLNDLGPVEEHLEEWRSNNKENQQKIRLAEDIFR